MCALLLALHAKTAGAAPFDFADTSWEGTSELLALARERLGNDRVRIVARLDYSELSPRDGILLLHPEVEPDYGELSAFLAAGGRLALLDDYGLGDRLLARYQIHRVQAPLRPELALRGKPHLAIAIPAVQTVAGQEQNRHPIVANVERLVTNHPTALTNPKLTPVLTIPAIGEPDATLAVTGVIAGRGRLFAMGDPSPVINLMLRYPGNRTFAAGLIDYLVENDSWGPRAGTLYLVANRFEQAARFGRAEGLTGELNEAAASARETLSEWHEDGLPYGVALAVAGAAGLLALFWAGRFAFARYRRVAPRYATETPLVAQGGLPGRAAVLAAPTTDRALVISELDSLLVEALARRAGIPASSGADAAIAALRAAGESEAVLHRARALLPLGRKARTAILSRQPSRLRAGQLTEHAKNVFALVAELERAGNV